MLAVAFSAIFVSSCSKDELEGGNNEFTLRYFSFTDVSTGKGFEIPAPSYNGPVPSEFRITSVSHDSGYDGDNFTIDSETGAITYTPAVTEDGEYRISVACKADGNEYTFDNALTVKFLLEFPGSLVFTPEEFVIDAALIKDGTPNDLNNKVTVKAEAGAVSIKKYELANVMKEGEEKANEEYKTYFSVNAESGSLSIVKGKEVKAGTYNISYKINTEDNNETIASETARVKVIAKPDKLAYKGADNGIVDVEEKVGVTFKPEYEFSTGDLEFSMVLVPATDKISIDKATGNITVADKHDLTRGTEFKATVTVRNDAAPEGVEFKDVLTLRIIELIVPVTAFSYDTKEIVYIQSFSAEPEYKTGETNGKPEEYEIKDWGTLGDYKDYVDFNTKTGVFSAEKMHKIPVSETGYTVTVSAWNKGNSKPTTEEQYKNGATATFTLKVAENPNWFTHFSYGNNLGTDGTALPESETQGVSQFRYYGEGEAGVYADGTVAKPIKYNIISGIPSNSTMSYQFRNRYTSGSNMFKGKIEINSVSGEIVIEGTADSPNGRILQNNQIGILMVEATAGEDPTSNISVTIPVFVQVGQARNNVYVEYTPFILRVNPKDGGRSNAPIIYTNAKRNGGTLLADEAYNKFQWGFGKELRYIDMTNLPETWANAQIGKKNAGTDFWNQSKNDIGDFGSVGINAPFPIFYYYNMNNLDKAYGYFDNASSTERNRFAFTVNPGKWILNNTTPADGILTAQFNGQSSDVKKWDNTTDNSSLGKSPIAHFNFAVWLDSDFESEAK